MKHNANHPVDQLEREHAVILRVLEAAEEERMLLARGAPLREPFWRTFLDFLAGYADRCHHMKEEDVLFAALEAAGMPRDVGPTSCMRSEHAEMRAVRARLAEALTSDDVETISHLIGLCIGTLRVHIGKENDVLFPMARQMLDDAAVAEIAGGFEAAGRAIGDDERRRLEAVAESLRGDAAQSSGAVSAGS